MPLPSAAEFLARAIVFGALVIGGIAAIVVAGTVWAALVAAFGLLLAAGGLVTSVLVLLDREHATAWRASRPVALAHAALALAAIVVALVA